jgi:prophage regulatory protein
MPKRIEPDLSTRPAYATDSALAAHFGVNRATIWNWPKVNHFPQPVKLSPQMTRWKWSDVTEWEAAQRTAA